MPNDLEMYKANGIKDCVGKPFTSQELWRCLMKYFKPKNWQTVAESQHTIAEDELRYKLIANFVKDNQNRFSEIKNALNSGDIKLAHRLAHTLKSNAAHLDKTLLQKAASDVELQLKDGQNLATAQQLAALETELDAALTELQLKVKAKAEADIALKDTVESLSGTADQGEPVNMEFIEEIIGKLEPILQMGSLDCRDYIDSLRLIPGTEELRQQIDNLDLEDALVTLGELKKKLVVF
jgi:HPt (histidine-containing phosphotransfer) domain-containing protein